MKCLGQANPGDRKQISGCEGLGVGVKGFGATVKALSSGPLAVLEGREQGCQSWEFALSRIHSWIFLLSFVF